jgi:gallate dioxygenase
MEKGSVLGPTAPLRGLVRMTPQRAQRGYRLGRFLTSMRDPAARAAFAADPEASMAASGLTEQERALVRSRDYDGMLDYGVSNVAIGKASPALGTTLVERGAKGRGQTAAEFIAERRARNEGQPWQF